MPGNVALASPVLVFPNSLSTSFTESSVFPVARNDYHDNTIERYMIVYTSPLGTDYDPPRARPLRRWSLAKRLGRNVLNDVSDPEDKFQILRDFWLAVDGGLTPFFFYPDPRDFDPTGANETGQAVCVFGASPWGQAVGPVMSDASFELIEVA